jgi:hypothetical protein
MTTQTGKKLAQEQAEAQQVCVQKSDSTSRKGLGEDVRLGLSRQLTKEAT